MTKLSFRSPEFNTHNLATENMAANLSKLFEIVKTGLLTQAVTVHQFLQVTKWSKSPCEIDTELIPGLWIVV